MSDVLGTIATPSVGGRFASSAIMMIEVGHNITSKSENVASKIQYTAPRHAEMAAPMIAPQSNQQKSTMGAVVPLTLCPAATILGPCLKNLAAEVASK